MKKSIGRTLAHIDVAANSSVRIHKDFFNTHRCQLNRSMQQSSNLLVRLCFSKRPNPLGCTQLNLNRAVFSLNQRS
jgi:hypothetical protein